jgi:hypothetical protein
MNATQQLHDLGQSLWLDNITRALLTSGTLSRYIRDFAVTGLSDLDSNQRTDHSGCLDIFSHNADGELCL